MFYIPLQATPYYTQFVTLDELNFEMTFRWSTEEAAWYLDLREINDTIVIRGIKLVTGCDLLLPYIQLDLGSLFMFDMNNLGAEPDFENIGGRFRLVYTGKDETV